MGAARLVVHPKDNKKDKKLIYVRYTFRGQITYFSTGVHINEPNILRDEKGRIDEKKIIRTTSVNPISKRKTPIIKTAKAAEKIEIRFFIRLVLIYTKKFA